MFRGTQYRVSVTHRLSLLCQPVMYWLSKQRFFYSLAFNPMVGLWNVNFGLRTSDYGIKLDIEQDIVS